jgi:MFS family permease
MNVSRLLGPAIAGFVVAALGEGICFLLNALSYVAVIVALLMIKGNFAPREDKPHQSVITELKDGFSYTMNSSPIRAIISLMALFGLGSMAYSVLMPVYVKELHGDANMLGYLMAASAFGSLVGTLVLASRKGILGLGKWIAVSSVLFSLCLIAFSFVHSFWLAMAVLAVMGAMLMVNFAACSTILQAVVHDEKRGRVMSLFTLSFMGSTPIGSLTAGAVADRVGFSTTIMLCGVYCLIVAGLFAVRLPKLRREARPIYIERGLLRAEEEVDLLSV